MKVQDKRGRTYVYAVRKTPGEQTYEGKCSCGFPTTGWPTKKLAEARITEHAQEHETGKPMSELVDFKIKNGLAEATVEPTVASLFGEEEEND